MGRICYDNIIWRIRTLHELAVEPSFPLSRWSKPCRMETSRMRIAIHIPLVLISLSSGLMAQDVSAAKPYDVDEAYQVYSVLLPHEESYGFAKGTLVIQKETVSHSIESGCFDSKSASRFRDALTDYSNMQMGKWLLQKNFRIEKSYDLVSSETINLLFKERGVAGWQDFYHRYPNSGGFIIMSPVGFNKTKTLAVVYTGSSCSGLCGRWGFHLLEKSDGKWREVPGVSCFTVS
jgi:hypothetical protein